MSIGLKLYFLRSRIKNITQTVMAKELGVRQATISNIEQDLSQPSLPLLRTLCEYFDVTPTYLLDGDGPLEPRPSDRWRNRHGLLTTGQYLEVPHNALHKVSDKSYLVALLPGTPVYDEEAARARAVGADERALSDAYRLEVSRRQRQQRELRRSLDTERQKSRLRRHGVSMEKAEKMLRRE